MRMLGRAGAAAGLAAVLALGVGTMAAQAHDWQIDPAKSMAKFSTQYTGVNSNGSQTMQGSLHGISGTIHFEAGNPNSWRVDATIPTNTVDTGEAARDTGLKGPQFFDAAKYPSITFKSTGVKQDSSSGYQVRGNLTLHGVTRPVTLILDSPGDARLGMDATHMRRGFHATATISRKDFGLTNAALPGGDKVKIVLEIEAVEK